MAHAAQIARASRPQPSTGRPDSIRWLALGGVGEPIIFVLTFSVDLCYDLELR